MKKRDWIVTGSLAAALAVLLLALRLGLSGRESAGRLEIYVDGALYQSVPLRAGEEITVSQPDGSVNILHMTENGFYMAYSTCQNQLCVQQGEVNAENWNRRTLGAHVICLPNRVDAALVTQRQGQAADAPDV